MPELVFDDDGFIDLDGYDGMPLGFVERRSADRILRTGLAAGLRDGWEVPGASGDVGFYHAADVGFDLPQAAVARFDVGPPRRRRPLPRPALVAGAVAVLLTVLLGARAVIDRPTDEAGLQGIIGSTPSTVVRSAEGPDGIEAPSVAVVGESVTFTATGTDAGVGSITWFVGEADGLELGEDGGEEVGAGTSLDLVFDAPGRYQVRAVIAAGVLSETRDAIVTVVTSP